MAGSRPPGLCAECAATPTAAGSRISQAQINQASASSRRGLRRTKGSLTPHSSPFSPRLWAVGPAALPCAEGIPPQRPPDTSLRRLRAATPAASPCHLSLTQLVLRSLHCVCAAGRSPALCRQICPLPHAPVGAGLVAALYPAKSRTTLSSTAAAYSPPDPFRPKTGTHPAAKPF